MNIFVKTTRALLALLPAVLLSVQCSQEELAGPENPKNPGTVTLTIKNAEPTKTYIDGETGKVYWTDGEVIIINGEVYSIVVDETDPTVATVPDVAASESYFVVYNNYYPASDPEEGRLLVNFPDEQTYREDSFSDYSNIMAGYSTSTDIRMYNIGGVVKFGVTGNCTLTSLSFSTKDGSPVAGYLLLPEDQLLNGELGDNSVFYENPDYGITASSTINIENSGVSKMALDKLQADKVSIDNSGSSSIAVSSISAASSISVDNSGASKSSFSDLKATSAAIKSSGSSNLNITGIGVSHIAAKASGASKIALEGKAQDADYDSSGSSKVDASNLECNIANVESSGASSVKAYATNNAYVDSSRSSKVSIEGGANVVNK